MPDFDKNHNNGNCSYDCNIFFIKIIEKLCPTKHNTSILNKGAYSFYPNSKQIIKNYERTIST